MPMLDAHQEEGLQSAWRTTRIVGLATCVATPLIYLVVLYSAAFQRDTTVFVGALKGAEGPIPWNQPLVLALVVLSVVMVGQVLFLRNLFAGQARNAARFEEALGRLRTGTIVCCALLESVAIFGLVLGFVASKSALPLDLALIAVPVLGYFPLIPGLAFWRSVLESGSFR